MPAMKTSQTETTEERLLREHRELVTEYPVQSGAAKAVISRKIGERELDLTLAGVSFDPFEKPTAYRTSYELSESQLRDQIAALRSLIAEGKASDVVTHAAERRLARFEQQAERRGVSI